MRRDNINDVSAWVRNLSEISGFHQKQLAVVTAMVAFSIVNRYNRSTLLEHAPSHVVKLTRRIVLIPGSNPDPRREFCLDFALEVALPLPTHVRVELLVVEPGRPL